MTAETAILAQMRGPMLAAKAQAILLEEVVKGCERQIAPQPVALEPVFQPIGLASEDAPNHGTTNWVFETPAPLEDMARLQVWVSPEQRCDWDRSERFVKLLYFVGHRVGLEILGNRHLITIRLLCHREDLPSVRTAFYSEFERCELTLADTGDLSQHMRPSGQDMVLLDFLPPPPYSHLLTQPDELGISPYASIMTSLANLEGEEVLGMYQILFQPVSPEHNWHHNVQRLVDLEFTYKLMTGWQPPQRYQQQVPSGDLRHMATDTETKAHNDKPFFSAAMRVAVLGAGDRAHQTLRALSTFRSLIQHGGRPLEHLTEADYQTHLSDETIRQMFVHAHTYRPGFLLNSQELTSLFHIPPTDVSEHRATCLQPLEPLRPDPSLRLGTPIGTCNDAGRDLPVCIPADVRPEHLHMIGGTGCGKSTLMLSTILHDIQQGHGVAVIDPHGPLIHNFLRLVPSEHIDRVIYINPGDPDWVPIWNPLHCNAGQDPGRVADDIIGAFRSFITGWGDRLEHLLRHALIGALHLPGGNLLDVSDLLRWKCDEGNQLRQRVLNLVQYEVSRQFWRTDFANYRPAELGPPQHKLSKLLSAGPASLMLCQSQSSFELRDVMDKGKILLFDLSTIGSELRSVLGCFLLSLLHHCALTRSDAPEETHKLFPIHCDEAHRFLTDAIEDLIAETRKFSVPLSLAHQYMSQFGAGKTDALSSVGSAIIFKVDSKDAAYLKKDLQGRVAVEDLITLKRGEAIARIGTEIVRIKTPKPLAPSKRNPHDLIIEQSRARYYRPIADVQKAIRNRADRWIRPFSPLTAVVTTSPTTAGNPPESAADTETFEYDRL